MGPGFCPVISASGDQPGAMLAPPKGGYYFPYRQAKPDFGTTLPNMGLQAERCHIAPGLQIRQTQGQQPPHRVASDASDGDFYTADLCVTCVTCVTGRREKYFHQPLAVTSAVSEGDALFPKLQPPSVHHLLETFGGHNKLCVGIELLCQFCVASGRSR